MKRRTAILFSIAFLSAGLLALNMKWGPPRRLLRSRVEIVRVEDFKLVIPSAGVVEPEVLTSIKTDHTGAVAGKMVREGDLVQAGQKLMEFSIMDDQAELEHRQTQIKAARQDCRTAQSDYQMTRELYRQRAVPKKELSDAAEALEKARAAVGAAVRDYQAQLKKVGESTVTSPISGVVLADKVGNNSWVASGSELFVIGQLDRLRVRAKVDELDIGKIRAGQPADATLEAFPGATFPGVVESIGAEAEQGAFAEVDVLVGLTDLKGLPVKPNLSAKVDFEAGTIPGALTIPMNCVQYEGSANFVNVITPGGVTEKRTVQLGGSADGRIVVTDGLGAGEAVLVPDGRDARP